MDMYERQNSRASWENEYSDYFGCINGVRQVVSINVHIYMDELLNQMQDSGIGCHIGQWVLWITGICRWFEASVY